MDYNFERCLEKKKLVKFDAEKSLIKKEIVAAESDLKDSQDVLKLEKPKLAIITAYYSMFHAARALLYSKGYREKSHFCLRAAIKNLFVDTNLLESSFIDDYDMAKDLRENADYKSDFSQEGAEQLIVKAEKFLAKVKTLLAI
ncbi:MAG: HEPN domain-containing protein [Candidatus Omnitrophica bacterium]|nr:HEPN domain-containing protein [Candidatus Omnitrophota bacterium]MBU4589622.1 HEPN domain-containing protein [Candidatus Omnitrophota bacterium]